LSRNYLGFSPLSGAVFTTSSNSLSIEIRSAGSGQTLTLERIAGGSHEPGVSPHGRIASGGLNEPAIVDIEAAMPGTEKPTHGP
jgi:hypothetical protein